MIHDDKECEYVGITCSRFEKRIHEHCHTDKASAVYKHLKFWKREGSGLDFSILESGYDKEHDRRIAEAIFTKERGPFLNKQKKTYKLSLFN